MKQCYLKNELEKKRQYNERVLQVEHGSFSPLVFNMNGGMGNECHAFYSRLADLLGLKRHLSKSLVSSWLKTKINFALLRSMILCVRGSRTVKKMIDLALNEVEIAEKISKQSMIALRFPRICPIYPPKNLKRLSEIT